MWSVRYLDCRISRLVRLLAVELEFWEFPSSGWFNWSDSLWIMSLAYWFHATLSPERDNVCVWSVTLVTVSRDQEHQVLAKKKTIQATCFDFFQQAYFIIMIYSKRGNGHGSYTDTQIISGSKSLFHNSPTVLMSHWTHSIQFKAFRMLTLYNLSRRFTWGRCVLFCLWTISIIEWVTEW